MRTAREMDAYAREHGHYMGSPALKHFEVIEEHLLADENVLVALVAAGVYNGREIIMGGSTAVAFTNKRLIYGRKGIIMGSPVKIVNLESINDIYKNTFGLLSGKIYIDTLKENIGISLALDELDKIFIDILQVLENYRATKNNNATLAVSAADELKKFKELLDMGVITQEEFDAKKKQLLGL